MTVALCLFIPLFSGLPFIVLFIYLKPWKHRRMRMPHPPTKD